MFKIYVLLILGVTLFAENEKKYNSPDLGLLNQTSKQKIHNNKKQLKAFDEQKFKQLANKTQYSKEQFLNNKNDLQNLKRLRDQYELDPDYDFMNQTERKEFEQMFPPFQKYSEKDNKNTKQSTKQGTNQSKIQDTKQKFEPYQKIYEVSQKVNQKCINGRGFFRFHIGSTLQKQYLYIHAYNKLNNNEKQLALVMSIKSGKTITCQKRASDTCYIRRNDLTADQNIPVTVHCESNSIYTAQFAWNNLEHIKPGQTLNINPNLHPSSLYIIELEEKDKNFEQLRIFVKPQEPLDLFNLKVYGFFGHASSQNFKNPDVQSKSLWQDGQIIVLRPKDMKGNTLSISIQKAGIQANYSISVQLVTQKQHKIELFEIIYEYLQKQETKDYYIAFDQPTYEEFSLHIAEFSGQLSIQLYTNKQKTKIYNQWKYSSMQDFQYIFTRNDLKQNQIKGLYLQIRSKNKDSTYKINLSGRSQQNFIELYNNVYDFISYKAKKYAFFSFSLNRKQYTPSPLKNNFTVNMINLKGNSSLKFKLCKRPLVQCLYNTSLDKINNLEAIISHIGTRKVHKISIYPNQTAQIAQNSQKGVIFIEITDATSLGQTSAVSLEFIDSKYFKHLRENRILEEKLNAQQERYYKFINSDPNVQQIRIIVNEIQGSVQLFGYQNPQNQMQQINRTENTFLFTKSLTSPIFMMLRSISSSIISISVNLIYKNSLMQDKSILMNQQTELTITIAAKSDEIIQFCPIKSEIQYIYHSSGQVVICKLDNNNVCLQDTFEYKTSGKLYFQNTKNKCIKISVFNPYQQKSVRFASLYHDKRKKHCDRKKMAITHYEPVQSGTCFSFAIQKIVDHEVIFSIMEYGQIEVTIYLCRTNMTVIRNEGKFLKASQINKICKDQSQKIIFADIFVKDKKQKQQIDKNLPEKVKIAYSVIPQNSSIQLLDGLSFYVNDKSRSGPLKILTYKVVNKIDTAIFLHQDLGKFQFFVKIISKEQKNYQTVSKEDYTFRSSTNESYDKDPSLRVTKNQFLEQPCQTCIIIAAIYTTSQYGSRIACSFEIIQNNLKLVDQNVKKNYIKKNQKQYYSYTSSQKKSIMVQVDDNGLSCTKISVQQTEFQSLYKNHSQVSLNGELVIQTEQKVYYIIVEGIQTCPYQIVVHTLSANVSRLYRGQLFKTKMEQKQIKYFIFRRADQKPFKILTMNKFGDVQISIENLNGIDVNQTMNKIKNKMKNKLELQYHSPNRNLLYLNNQSKLLCGYCRYAIAVKAIRNTQTWILLIDDETQVPLSNKKVFHDYLENKNDTTLAKYHRIQNTNIIVTVYSGQIQVSYAYLDQNKSQIFKKLNGESKMIIKIDNQRSENEYESINLKFTAKANKTTYSIEMKNDNIQQDNFEQHKIYTGRPNYVKMTNKKIICMSGTLRDNNEEIFLSVNTQNIKQLQKLKFQMKINNKIVEHKTKIIRNIVNLQTQLKTIKNKKYSLCFKYKKNQINKNNNNDQQQQQKKQIKITFPITIMQLDDLNILPQSVKLTVSSSRKFVIYTANQFILEFFNCKGKSIIKYAQSMKLLQNITSKPLNVIGVADQSHAIKLDNKDTTFIEVQGQSQIKWTHIDYQKQIGIGYFKYTVGDIKYSTDNQNIIINFQGIKNRSSTQTVIQKLDYQIYVSNSTQNLTSALQCKIQNLGVQKYKLKSQENIILQKKHQYKILKSQILKLKGQANDFFVSIAVVMKLKSRNQQETYKLIYNREQVPFPSLEFQNEVNQTLWLVIGLVLLLLILIVVTGYLVIQKILPYIARLKSRTVLNEVAEEIPPQSSDRRTIEIQTSQKPPESDNQMT